MFRAGLQDPGCSDPVEPFALESPLAPRASGRLAVGEHLVHDGLPGPFRQHGILRPQACPEKQPPKDWIDLALAFKFHQPFCLVAVLCAEALLFFRLRVLDVEGLSPFE